MKIFSKTLLLDILLIYLLSSCNFYKALNQISKEEYNYNSKFSKFKFEDNQIMINTTFRNNISVDMLFDLGAGGNCIFMDSTFREIVSSQKPISGPGKSVSAEGVRMKNNYYQFGDVSTQWFNINNCFIKTSIRPMLFPCNYVSGIWGSSIAAHSFSGKGNKIVVINMQDTTLGMLDSMPSLDTWIPIETNYNKMMGLFQIKVIIGRETLFFYFDTGFNGSMAMKKKDFEIARKANTFFDENILYGNIFHSLSGLRVDSANVSKTQVTFNDKISADSISILSTKALAFNVIGMDFLKRFNILVDYQNFKIYLQPNPNFQKQKDSFFIIKGFKPKNTVSNGICIQNIFVNSIAEKAGLKVGDQIVSINSIKSDPSNNCDIVELFSNLDGRSINNEIVIKRGNEILKFVL